MGSRVNPTMKRRGNRGTNNGESFTILQRDCFLLKHFVLETTLEVPGTVSEGGFVSVVANYRHVWSVGQTHGGSTLDIIVFFLFIHPV